MRLNILALILTALCTCIEGKANRCRYSGQCREGEECVLSSPSFWWYRQGVCKPIVRKCTTGTDCKPDECCQSTAQLKGRKKRQTGGSDGVCKPLQSSGNKCFTKFGSGKPDGMVFSCPCEFGSTCKGSGVSEVPLGEIGICEKVKTCTSGADCGADECCERTAQLKGRKKRQTVGSDGVCKPLQSSGNKCFTKFGSGKPDGMVFSCPCESGSTCKGSGVSEVPLGEIGVCKKVKTCTSGADCGADECCESIAQLRGRRKRQSVSDGVCKPLQSSGNSCFTMFGSGKPAGMVFSCPCESGSTCQGSGVSEFPLGEIGICG